MKKILCLALVLIFIFLFSGCLYESPPDKLVKVDAIKASKVVDYPNERINLVVDGVDVLVTVSKSTDIAILKLGGVNVTAKISRKHSPRIFTIGEKCSVDYYD